MLTLFCNATVEWVETGISMYFFPRSAIPADITAGTPLPSGWGLPMASFPATTCNTSSHFYDHSIIFDTTFWCALALPALCPGC